MKQLSILMGALALAVTLSVGASAVSAMPSDFDRFDFESVFHPGNG